MSEDSGATLLQGGVGGPPKAPWGPDSSTGSFCPAVLAAGAVGAAATRAESGVSGGERPKPGPEPQHLRKAPSLPLMPTCRPLLGLLSSLSPHLALAGSSSLPGSLQLTWPHLQPLTLPELGHSGSWWDLGHFPDEPRVRSCSQPHKRTLAVPLPQTPLSPLSSPAVLPHTLPENTSKGSSCSLCFTPRPLGLSSFPNSRGNSFLESGVTAPLAVPSAEPTGPNSPSCQRTSISTELGAGPADLRALGRGRWVLSDAPVCPSCCLPTCRSGPSANAPGAAIQGPNPRSTAWLKSSQVPLSIPQSRDLQSPSSGALAGPPPSCALPLTCLSVGTRQHPGEVLRW